MNWGDDSSGRPLLFDYGIYWGFQGRGGGGLSHYVDALCVPQCGTCKPSFKERFGHFVGAICGQQAVCMEAFLIKCLLMALRHVAYTTWGPIDST